VGTFGGVVSGLDAIVKLEDAADRDEAPPVLNAFTFTVCEPVANPAAFTVGAADVKSGVPVLVSRNQVYPVAVDTAATVNVAESTPTFVTVGVAGVDGGVTAAAGNVTDKAVDAAVSLLSVPIPVSVYEWVCGNGRVGFACTVTDVPVSP
jgi:hypothetical protein